ncbi:MAG: hypothetical protein GY751_04275 [Bacteroidetes bacterium]|nr:hypothetical protein [Bacteroidota bacterium]
MIGSYVIGILGIVFLMLTWVLVQSWWGKVFPDDLVDEDVLAGRTDCGNCGCTTACKNKNEQLSEK